MLVPGVAGGVQDGSSRRLLALGASMVREPGGDIHWWVLADPEGHEFCAFPPPAQAAAFENDADAEQIA